MSKIRRVSSVLLAVLLFITAVLPVGVSAANGTLDLSRCEVSWDYTLTDYDGNAFTAAYGIRSEDNVFGESIAPMNRAMHDYTVKRPGLTGNRSEWVYGQDYLYCFCIEHGVPLPDSGSYSGSSDPAHGNKYERLSDEQKDLLNLVLIYGYTNRTDLETSKDANACYAATQLLIWQVSLGFRSSPTQLDDRSYPADGYTGTMTEQYTSNPYLKAYYDRILSDMASHYTRPSFTAFSAGNAKIYAMDNINDRYTVTLIDENHVLDQYDVTASGGVSTEISGNKLTITSAVPLNDTVTVKLNRRTPSTDQTTGFLIWSVAGAEAANQDMVSGVRMDNDPVPAYLKVQTIAGSAKIVKTSEDGKVAGITFTVTGNGVNQTVQTGPNGEIQIDNLTPGVYTVTEQNYDKYEPQEVRRVTVVSGQVATVNFNNVLKRGELTVTKTSEDGLNEGVTFRLSGTSLSGLAVDEYAVTDSSGVARFDDVQTCDGYVLHTGPVPFQIDGIQTVVTVEKYNLPQKGTITVSKSGEVFTFVSENNGMYQPVFAVQGLEGAVYEITAAEDIYTLDGTLRASKGEVVDTITTGADGTAKSKELYLGKYEVKEITAPYGMVLNDEIHAVELVYAGQEVAVTETSTSFYNERQKAAVTLDKILEQNEQFGIGANGEITAVTFGLFAAEDVTAADGSVIPADGLLEILSVDESGHVVCKTDLPFGSFYFKELSTDEHYILSDEKYPFEFSYMGQDTALVEIKANDGEVIGNDLIYGRVKGLKMDRETEGAISGALFGLFYADTEMYTEGTAILTAESGEDGVFTFETIPYGNWIVKELKPAEGFLPNEELYPVTVSENGETIEITVVNDRIPEIATTADVDGEKEICATEIFTLTDTVEYKHLIPGKEYALKGVLMDKTAGEPLLIDGEDIHAETVFTPDKPCGEVTVAFTFDARAIKADTEIVVFETLYCDGQLLVLHTDWDDEAQTIEVSVPEIHTAASVDGEKAGMAKDGLVVEDVVSYRNLTPGKEYVVKGILADKATGEPFAVHGEEICSEVVFTPDRTEGEIIVSFSFDASLMTETTELVVFQRIYREGVEITAHADREDEGQTVKIHVPEIRTRAAVDGGKTVTAGGKITLEDTVIYRDLIPGRTYVLRGILMDKATRAPFLEDGKEICGEAVFTPEEPCGEITVRFSFDSGDITEKSVLVVFESLWSDGVELLEHADWEDKDQTVEITPPLPPVSDSPQTGDDSSLGFWIGLSAVTLGCLIACVILYLKNRKDDSDE